MANIPRRPPRHDPVSLGGPDTLPDGRPTRGVSGPPIPPDHPRTLWTTARGETVFIDTVEDRHLLNIQRLTRSRAEDPEFNGRESLVAIDAEVERRGLRPLAPSPPALQEARTLLTTFHGLWPRLRGEDREQILHTLRWMFDQFDQMDRGPLYVAARAVEMAVSEMEVRRGSLASGGTGEPTGSLEVVYRTFLTGLERSRVGGVVVGEYAQGPRTTGDEGSILGENSIFGRSPAPTEEPETAFQHTLYGSESRRAPLTPSARERARAFAPDPVVDEMSRVRRSMELQIVNPRRPAPPADPDFLERRIDLRPDTPPPSPPPSPPQEPVNDHPAVTPVRPPPATPSEAEPYRHGGLLSPDHLDLWDTADLWPVED